MLQVRLHRPLESPNSLTAGILFLWLVIGMLIASFAGRVYFLAILIRAESQPLLDEYRRGLAIRHSWCSIVLRSPATWVLCCYSWYS